MSFLYFCVVHVIFNKLLFKPMYEWAWNPDGYQTWQESPWSNTIHQLSEISRVPNIIGIAYERNVMESISFQYVAF